MPRIRKKRKQEPVKTFACSLRKVISGGQVGADIAGLRAAKAAGFPTGGYMPLGFLTLHGQRPEYRDLYGVEEIAHSRSYKHRTWRNVEAADATIRFAYHWHSPGELCTHNAIEFYGKPAFDLDPRDIFASDPVNMAQWVAANGYEVINIAGNSDEHLEVFVERYLEEVFKWLKTQS